MRPVRRRDEQGSMAIELAMIAPALLLIFALIYAYGRVSSVEGQLESGTRDAARTATTARSYDDAETRAQAILKQAMLTTPTACQATATATVDRAQFVPGEPVTTTGTCDFDLADIGLPGVHFTIHAKSLFVSPLDPNRGLDVPDDQTGNQTGGDQLGTTP